MLLRDWQNCFFTTCSLIIYKSAGLIFAFHSVENILSNFLYFHFFLLYFPCHILFSNSILDVEFFSGSYFFKVIDKLP